MKKTTQLSEEGKTDFVSRDRWLMFAFVLGPLAALSNLGISYTLVPTACEHTSKTMLHVSSFVFLTIAVLAGVIVRRASHTAPETPEIFDYEGRSSWMAQSAMILSFTSAVIIIAMEIPNLVMGSCA